MLVVAYSLWLIVLGLRVQSVRDLHGRLVLVPVDAERAGIGVDANRRLSPCADEIFSFRIGSLLGVGCLCLASSLMRCCGCCGECCCDCWVLGVGGCLVSSCWCCDC